MANKPLTYTGKVHPRPGSKSPVNNQTCYPYLPAPELVEVVGWAIELERPLLLMGRPGSGKTQLAHAVAFELGLKLEEWYVRSTSRVIDGLYRYDAVGQIRDAQLDMAGRLPPERQARLSQKRGYVEMGPVGRAFEHEERTVLLIDEIDKADLDFPNDLLQVLEERRFTIDELGITVEANQPPIVFITSNDEKELPDAFLRRCLFYYIEFPTARELRRILRQRFKASPNTLVNRAVDTYVRLRQHMQATRPDTAKQVGTSELIDWFRLLMRDVDGSLAAIEGEQLPYSNALFKSRDDLELRRAQLPPSSEPPPADEASED